MARRRYCGVDLAVKKPDTVALIETRGEGAEIHLYTCRDLGELARLLSLCDVIAIDSPFSLSSGYRSVDLEMISEGFRVFPPNFIRGLVEKNLRLLDLLSRTHRGVIIETHPRSSEKSSGLYKEALENILGSTLSRDEADALLCALVAVALEKGYTRVFRAEDGEIHILSRDSVTMVRALLERSSVVRKRSCGQRSV